MNVETCSSERCGASIIWTKTAKNRPMPVDLAPVEDGNLVLTEDDDGVVHSSVVEAGDLLRALEPRYVSHFATCPDADRFRGRR